MNRTRSHPPRRRGFVLLLAIIVLAVAGAVLAAAGSRSAERAAAAADARLRLQQHWGAASCRGFALAHAEALLAAAEAEADRPLVTATCSLRLGDMEFDLVVSDEQAKVNVNALAAGGDRLALERSLRLLQADQRRPLALRLAPDPRAADAGRDADELRAYRNLEQVFAADGPNDLIDPRAADQAAGQRITCWGDGRVNLHRADRRVLRRRLGDALTESELDELVRYRDEHPDLLLVEAVRHLDLPAGRAEKLPQLLTDTSRCHGVWVVVTGNTRRWYSFAARQQSDSPAGEQRVVISW